MQKQLFLSVVGPHFLLSTQLFHIVVDYQMAPLVLVAYLATKEEFRIRTHVLHLGPIKTDLYFIQIWIFWFPNLATKFKIWSSGGATCINCKFGHQMAPLDFFSEKIIQNFSQKPESKERGLNEQNFCCKYMRCQLCRFWIGTNTSGAIWWSNLELIQVAPSGSQICN